MLVNNMLKKETEGNTCTICQSTCETKSKETYQTKQETIRKW